MGVRCGSVSIKIMVYDNRWLGRMAVLSKLKSPFYESCFLMIML